MLSKLAISLYEVWIEISLWVCVVVGGVVGFKLGSLTNDPILGSTLGIAIGCFLAFFIASIIFGLCIQISEIRKNTNALIDRYNS